jgi:type I restriction enzyme S subunit
MDAQQFLAEFGHIANAPGGVARLRELVLQMAISGRLTERVPGDVSAVELIDLNRREQKALLAKKALKRQPDPSAVESNDHPWALPVGWAWSRLGYVTNYGDAPKVEFDDVSEDTWVLELEDVEKGTSRLLAKVFARDRKFKSTKNGFPAGAVLYGKLRPYLDKVLIADSPGVCTTEISPISFFDQIDAGYLRWYLKSPYFIAYADGSTYGMNLPRLGTDSAREALFPFPPQREQSRIVAKVDELMTLCDQLEKQQKDRRRLQNTLRQSTLQALASAESPHELQESWQRLQANFGCLFNEPRDVRELRATCVELAIRGVLTPAADHESPVNASQLLDHLASFKSGKRSPKAVPVDPPFDLPTMWCWARFDDLLDGSESGWSPKCDAEPRRPGEWGVLKVSAVTWGEFRPDENKRLPPSLDPRPECEIKPGDFLLSRANTAELVARSVITADGVPDRLMMSDKIVRLRFIDPELKPWANLVNNSLFAREYYRSNATGTSDSMRNVSRQVIHDLPIPLPPKHVQEAVMRKLTDLNRLCVSLEEQLKHAALNAERLAASSVATFTGITIERGEETAVKAPQTDLIALLRLGIAPDVRAQAPLATLLARHNGEMSASDLWQRFGGEIDVFYAQLKTEVEHGWIQDPSYELDPNAPAGPKKYPDGAQVAKMKIKREV